MVALTLRFQHFQEPAYQGLEELSGAESPAGEALGCLVVLRQASREREALKSSGFFGVSWSAVVNSAIFSCKPRVTKVVSDNKKCFEGIKHGKRWQGRDDKVIRR